MAKTGQSVEEPVPLFEGICADTPLQDCSWTDRSKRFHVNTGERKQQFGDGCLCIVSWESFYPCTWMTNLHGQSRNWNTCGGRFLKHVDLEENAELLDQVLPGAHST